MNPRSLVPIGGNGDLFANLRRDMNRMFEDFGHDWQLPTAFRGTAFLSPKVDVAETEKGLELTAELPGIDAKDVDLDVEDGILTLKAERKSEREEKDEKKKYHLVERSYGTYLRRFPLPFAADEAKVDAKFDKGVLKVFVPRSPAAAKASRKIAIKNGA